MRDVISFTRLFVSLSVALSGLLTYFTLSSVLHGNAAVAFLAILFLGFGTSALNQIQERHSDAKMVRTASRPMARGAYSIGQGFGIVGALLLIASTLLYVGAGFLGLVYFAITLVLYNAIYTPMKRLSYWALIVGSGTGVIAPALGWQLAGGSLIDTRFVFIGVLFFVWQMPHFWFTLLMYRQDCSKAGLATLQEEVGEQGIARLIASWSIMTALTGIMCVFVFKVHILVFGVVGFLALYLSVASFRLAFRSYGLDVKFFKKRFMELNTYVMLVMVALIVNNFFFGNYTVVRMGA